MIIQQTIIQQTISSRKKVNMYTAYAITNDWILKTKISRHVKRDRYKRMNKIKAIEQNEEIEIVNSFMNVNEKNEKILYVISKKGIVYIYNFIKRLLITAIIATPRQIKKIYNACNIIPDNELLNICKEHEKQKLNK